MREDVRQPSWELGTVLRLVLELVESNRRERFLEVALQSFDWDDLFIV